MFYQCPAIIAIDTTIGEALNLIAFGIGVPITLVNMMYAWIVEVATSYTSVVFLMSVASSTLVVSVTSSILMSITPGAFMMSIV